MNFLPCINIIKSNQSNRKFYVKSKMRTAFRFQFVLSGLVRISTILAKTT